jgi:outer membrane protein OmpA-like peptidoglycan-associated protein
VATRGARSRPGLRLAVGGAAAAMTAAAVGAPPPGEPLSFVACPIARDTGPDTDLCFFAEYDGEPYALVNPPDWGNPQLKHRVLVEARVADGAPICGATLLNARISVLPEIDPSCDTLLPFDGSVRGNPGGIFNQGTPEQRAAALELASRVEADPALSLEPVMRESSYPLPVPPFEAESLAIYYPFESDRATDADMLQLLRLKDIALAVPARVEVTGHRGASRLTNGTTMIERSEMARKRAEKITGILRGLGVDAEQVETAWIDAPGGNTGRDDWRSRRVDLRIVPLGTH